MRVFVSFLFAGLLMAVLGCEGGLVRPAPEELGAALYEECRAKGGDVEQVGTVPELLAQGADPNFDVGYGSGTPFHRAVRFTRVGVVRLLIEAGADLEAPDKDGKPPICHVARGISGELLEILIEAGSDVNQANVQNGMTPLHYAAEDNNAKMARILLEHGARINARDHEGRTPLGAAARFDPSKSRLVQLLVERGGVQ